MVHSYCLYYWASLSELLSSRLTVEFSLVYVRSLLIRTASVYSQYSLLTYSKYILLSLYYLSVMLMGLYGIQLHIPDTHAKTPLHILTITSYSH